MSRETTDIEVGPIEFPNGWRIDVHLIERGLVYYQRWPPGVERQDMFDYCQRTPIDAFRVALAKAWAEVTQ